MVRIRTVEVVGGTTVRLGFTDGSNRAVDISPWMRVPVFQPVLDDPALFRAVSVDPVMGTITWPNGADLCPDSLYFGLPPAGPEPAAAGSAS